MIHKYRGYILMSLVYTLTLGGVIFYLRQPDSAAVEIIPPPTLVPSPSPIPTATVTPIPTPAPLRVHVVGAVQNSGVYTLPPNSIINDALIAAGRETAKADLARINLAEKLRDGQQVYIPTQAETVPPTLPLPTPVATTAPKRPESHTSNTTGGKVNINTASPEELDTLPGIGPSRAQAIIDNRPYASVEDITRVPGIGAATLEKLRDRITVD